MYNKFEEDKPIPGRSAKDDMSQKGVELPRFFAQSKRTLSCVS